MTTIRSIQTYIKGWLHPQSYISSEMVALLMVHGIFLLAVGLSNTFVNIFLWKVEKSLNVVVLFNAFQFATVPVFFILAGWLSKKTSLTANLRIGIICYSIFFIILLTIQDDAAHYAWLLGVLLGASSGFYYLSFNVLIYDFTTNDNRDFVMGINGLVVSIATMIAPFAAGLLIQSLKGTKGYLLIFSASLVMFIIAAVLSTKIPNKTINKQYYLKSILFMPFRKRNWTFVMTGEMVRGFREGVMMFLTNILLYSIISSEMFLGTYTLLTSSVQLLSFYFIASKIRPSTRKQYLAVGAIATALVSSAFMFQLSVTTLLIYGLVSSFFVTFVNNPSASLIYWVIHKTPNSNKRRIEGIVVREVYLNCGRVAGVLLLFAIPQNVPSIVLVILGLGLTQLLMLYLFNKVVTE